MLVQNFNMLMRGNWINAIEIHGNEAGMIFVGRIAHSVACRPYGFGRTGAQELARFLSDGRDYAVISHQLPSEVSHNARPRLWAAKSCLARGFGLCAEIIFAVVRKASEHVKFYESAPAIIRQRLHRWPELAPVLLLSADDEGHPCPTFKSGSGTRLMPSHTGIKPGGAFLSAWSSAYLFAIGPRSPPVWLGRNASYSTHWRRWNSVSSI